jgi:Mg-chelatase subunit ChlD
MNPEFPNLTREELEVRLTALLLGELPPAEAEAVRQLAASDAALGQMLARLEKAIRLVREGLAAPGEGAPATQEQLKLAPEKREQLLAQFKQPAQPSDPGARTCLSAGASPVPEADKNVRAPVVTPEQMGVKRIQPRRGKYRWIVRACLAGSILTVLGGLYLVLLPLVTLTSSIGGDEGGGKRRGGRKEEDGYVNFGNDSPDPREWSGQDSLRSVALSRSLVNADASVALSVGPGQNAALVPSPTPAPEPERLRTQIALPPATEDEAVKLAAGSAGNFAWSGSAPSSGGGAEGRGGGGGYGGGHNLLSLAAAPVATQPAPTAKPSKAVRSFGTWGSDEPLAEELPLVADAINGRDDGADAKQTRLEPGTPKPAQAAQNLGWEAAGDQVEFGLPTSGQTWDFENRGKVVAGKPAEVAAKSELTSRMESRGRGTTAEPQDPATELPIAADHFYADADGLASGMTRSFSRGGNRAPARGILTAPNGTTEALGRRPARPAAAADFGSVADDDGIAGRKSDDFATFAGAEVKLAEREEVTRSSGGVAGAAADRKDAGGSQLAGVALGQPGATALALLDSGLPPASLRRPVPDTQARFRSRYGMSPPASAPAPATKDDTKKSVATLGDTPMLGALFKAKPAEPGGERFDKELAQRLDDVSSGVQKLYASVATNSVAAGRDAFLGEQKAQAGNAWFESNAAPRSGDRYAKLSSAAIVLPGLNGQLAEGQADLGTTTRELREQLTLNYDFQPTAPANGPVVAGRPISDSSQVEGLEKKLALSREAEAPASADDFAKKKRELEEAIRFRNILALKTLSEETDADLPKSSVVEIVDAASPAAKPSASLWERAKQVVTGEPDQYESKARIRVEIDPARGKYSAIQVYNPYSIQTEFEMLQSRTILNKVAETLKLNQKWAKQYGEGRELKSEETFELLKNKLDVRPTKDRHLLEIGVKSEEPKEAALIANTVAEVYKQYRTEQREKMSRGGIKVLQDQFSEQDKEITQLQQEVDRLRPTETTASAAQQAEPPPPPKPPANAPVPQPEIASAENAFSTFSLNVADVSFKLAQASLEKGQMPDAAAIRSEEFINAFDYRDPEAAPGQPVAFAWERARFPFAHNRDALRFSVKTAAAGRAGNRPLNLVLLLDNSGSMERADRVLLIQQALRVLASQLQPQDKISVVTFARTPRLWLDAVPGGKAGEALEQIGTLTPQGGTDLGAALTLAYQTALRHYLPGGMNRVVVLTDGAANLGDVDPDSLKRVVEQHRKQGVALDCFGIGWEGYNDDLLEMLTRNGDGRYGFVNTPEAATTEFAAQLAGALQVAASDVKVQVEFNPARVTNWRQVGYAKHQLTKEQFRDNTVDAAEIAAQEAGNGLYVIEVNPNGQGNLATVRVRYKVPGTSDYRELEWPVPYTGTAVPLEQASPAMRLLVASAGFSEWLASSPFSAEVSPDRLLRLIGGVPEVYGADERPKKLEWMIRQAKSLSGK